MTAYDPPGTFSNSASWVYDARGRVSNEIRVIDVGATNNTYTFTSGYTQGDLPITLTYPGATTETVTTHYYFQTGAAKGLVGTSWYVGTNANQTGATYMASGQLDTLRLGNNKTTDYSYGPDLRLATLVNDSNHQDLTFDYDNVGNITLISDDVLDDASGNPQNQLFEYDSLNRLTKAYTVGGSSQGTYNETYAYDVLGNLTSKAGVTLAYTSTLPHAVTTMNGAVRFEYDDNGNMESRNNGSSTWSYDWTIDNRLKQASTLTTTVTFTYDADGNMVLRDDNGTATVYLGKLYQHKVSPSTETKHYVFNGQLVAWRQNTTVRFLLADHLGGTNVTLSSIGQLMASVRYGPWGNIRYSSGATSTEYRYTGQRADTTLGIYDYNARYYDPAIGRFLSGDSIVPDPTNPQGYNRYSYVRNSPLNYTDPTGHREDCNWGNGACGATSPKKLTPIWTRALLDNMEATQYYGSTNWSPGRYPRTNNGQHSGIDWTMFGTSFGGRETENGDWDYSRYGTEEFPLIPVYAGCDCRVDSVEVPGGGYAPGLVKLRSNNPEYSDLLLYYGHLRDIQVTSETGNVTPDTIIGYLEAAPGKFHVHLEIRFISEPARFMNPFPYLAPEVQEELLSLQGISYESTTTYQFGYPSNPANQLSGYYE